MASATTTTNHDDIRKWVEKHGGHPAIVADTQDNGRAGGILRIDFDEPGGNENEGLRRIGWDEFLDIFNEEDLAFLREEQGQSRFNKFVAKERAGA